MVSISWERQKNDERRRTNARSIDRSIGRSIDRPCGTLLDAKALCSFDSSIGYSFFLDKLLENGGRGARVSKRKALEKEARERRIACTKEIWFLFSVARRRQRRGYVAHGRTPIHLSHTLAYTQAYTYARTPRRVHVYRETNPPTRERFHFVSSITLACV